MEPEKTPGEAPGRSTIERFFSGLSEYIFQSRLGVADVQLVDYLSDMLMRFVRFERLHRRTELKLFARTRREPGFLLRAVGQVDKSRADRRTLSTLGPRSRGSGLRVAAPHDPGPDGGGPAPSFTPRRGG